MGFFDFFRRSKEPKTTGKVGRQVGEHNFQKGIENLGSGDWDMALEFFEATVPCFLEMENQTLGNCLIALGILYGAAGEKDKALDSIGTAQIICDQDSTIGKFLAGLKKRIERPDNSHIPSPFTLKGKEVDLFFHASAQVLISGVTKGQIKREQILDDMMKSIADGLLNKKIKEK